MYIALVSGWAAPADGNGLVPFGKRLESQLATQIENAVVENYKWDDDKTQLVKTVRTVNTLAARTIVIAHSYGANASMDALRAAGVQVDLLILLNPVHINWILPWNWRLIFKPWVTKDIAKKCICYFNKTFPPNANVADGINRDISALGLDHSTLCSSSIVQGYIVEDIKGIL